MSLREAFEYGDRILDLRCYPHERIALMRLLICIAQRALNGPADEDEWRRCREELPQRAKVYLDKYKHCFNLLGDGHRFLQAPGLKSKPISVDKLNLVSAAGNTATWHDNAGGSERQWSLHELALMLLTYQVCSPGGLIGIGQWNGVPTGKDKSSQHSLGARDSAVHGFLMGSSLLDHVYLNLVCKDQLCTGAPVSEAWGTPVWENPPTRPPETPVRSYLGRLVPMARAIWLIDDRRSVLLANGLRYEFYPEGPRDPTLTIVLRDGQPTVLRGRPDRALWRELHAIAVYSSPAGACGPLTLRHVRFSSDACSLWAGFVLTEGNNDARVRDSVESRFRIPPGFVDNLDESGIQEQKRHPRANAIYREGVALAEQWCARLRQAVKVYRNTLGNQDKTSNVQAQAATRYWTTLEQKAESVLLHAVAVKNEGYVAGEDRWIETRSPWGKEVKRAALDAYEFTCPHATPKQLRAYAEGLKTLLGTDEKKNRSEPNADDTEDADAPKEETT